MITYDFTGRLTADSELRVTKTGKQVLKFTVAVNRYQQSTFFLNCNFWGARAEKLRTLFVKGRNVRVVGEPRESEYNGKVFETIEVYNAEPLFEKERITDVPLHEDVADGDEFVNELKDTFKSEPTPPEEFDDMDIPF